MKAIVLTSDPWAHVGGVREAVARGIPIYVNARSIPFLTRVVMAYFPGHRLLYGADLVFADRQQKGFVRTPAIELRRAVAREGLAVNLAEHAIRTHEDHEYAEHRRIAPDVRPVPGGRLGTRRR